MEVSCAIARFRQVMLHGAVMCSTSFKVVFELYIGSLKFEDFTNICTVNIPQLLPRVSELQRPALPRVWHLVKLHLVTLQGEHMRPSWAVITRGPVYRVASWGMRVFSSELLEQVHFVFATLWFRELFFVTGWFERFLASLVATLLAR